MASLAQQQYEKRTELDWDPLIGLDKASSETEEEGADTIDTSGSRRLRRYLDIVAAISAHLFDLCLQRMGGNHTEAEDVLSQAMMKVWDRLPDYAGKITDLRAWLTRLVHNLCLDIYRERQRRTKTVQSLDEMAVANEAALAQVLESPEEAVLRRELYLYIQHVINDLPLRQRDAAILRFVHAMPYAEIAKHLALSPENLRKCIKEARLILCARLNNYLSGDGPSSEKS